MQQRSGLFSSDDRDEEDALRQWIEIDNDAELLGLVLYCSYLTLYDTFSDISGVLANLSSASLHINTSPLPDLIFQ